jgi:hypothetical protein
MEQEYVIMTRIEILQKLSAGEITVEEATRLLQETNAEPAAESTGEGQAEAQADARPEAPSDEQTRHAVKPRWLRIRVSNSVTKHDYVKINIPFGFINAGRWMGHHFWGRAWADSWNRLMDAVDRGEIGTLVEVEDDAGGDRVHIYVE